MSAILTPPAPTPPKRMTLEEFSDRHGGDSVEFIDGRVTELPMPHPQHGRTSYRATKLLGDFVDDNDLGHICINDSFVKVPMPADPTRVRGADVCYFSYARVPKGPMPGGLLDVTPELVIEVRSPSDTWTEVHEKTEEYLANSVLAVIVLDIDSRTASVYRNPVPNQTVLNDTDTLTVPEVLPGWSVPVAKFFA